MGFSWYERAADGGHLIARYNLAVMLRTGQGVDANMAQAIAEYARAANHGLYEAQRALAELYYDGEDVPQDLDTARSWARLAHATRPDDPDPTIQAILRSNAVAS